MITIKLNPLTMLGTIISALYVVYVAQTGIEPLRRPLFSNQREHQKSNLDASLSSLLGVVLIAAIIPFPARWHAASLKWFGLLHKYRGRGFYLIFVGVLAFGCGIAGYVVGAVAILLGALHIVLAVWFKETRT